MTLADGIDSISVVAFIALTLKLLLGCEEGGGSLDSFGKLIAAEPN